MSTKKTHSSKLEELRAEVAHYTEQARRDDVPCMARYGAVRGLIDARARAEVHYYGAGLAPQERGQNLADISQVVLGIEPCLRPPVRGEEPEPERPPEVPPDPEESESHGRFRLDGLGSTGKEHAEWAVKDFAHVQETLEKYHREPECSIGQWRELATARYDIQMADAHLRGDKRKGDAFDKIFRGSVAERSFETFDEMTKFRRRCVRRDRIPIRGWTDEDVMTRRGAVLEIDDDEDLYGPSRKSWALIGVAAVTALAVIAVPILITGRA